MSQQSQKVGSLPTLDPPIKRKRGRPRKDENLHHGESTNTMSGYDTVKKNKNTVDANDDMVDKMVGKVVTGVIEGSTDAGYLITVKLADTDTQLKGVVFLPGKFTPITEANDVAPHVKMYTRKEVPFPTFSQQSQFIGFVQPEQSGKQPAEQKSQEPFGDYSDFMSDAQRTIGDYSNSNKVHMDDFLLDLTSGRKTVAELQELSVRSQSTPVMGGPESDKVVKLDESLKKTETPSPMEGIEDTDTDKESKAEPPSEPVALIMPATETVVTPADIELQPVNPDPKIECVHDVVKSPNHEIKQTPELEEPQPLFSEPPTKLINDVMENQAYLEKNEPQTKSEHAIENLSIEGKSLSDSTDITVAGSFYAPNPSQPAVMIDGEVVQLESKPKYQESLPSGQVAAVGLCSAPNPSQPKMMSEGEVGESETKFASEGPGLLGPSEPQICSSPAVISNVEGGMRDAIPPPQS